MKQYFPVRDHSYHTDKEKSPKASLGARCCVFINRLITVGGLCELLWDTYLRRKESE